jgi:O-antigen/teichoic acid export membrane protein
MASVGYAASTGILFLTYLVLARLVSPTDFGRYAAGGVIVGVGTLFAESGMQAALINRKDRIEESASTAFFALLISGSLLTLGALALSPLVGLYYHQAQVEAIAAAMSGWLFLKAATIVPDTLLQRRFSFLRRVAVDPAGSVAYAAVSIPLAALGAGAWALVGASYAASLLQLALAWWFARFVPRLRLASFSLWKELASFARPVIAAEALRNVAGQLDALTLGRFAGVAPLGQYRNGLRLADQPGAAFVSVTAYVLYPAFARIGHTRQRISAAARHVYWIALTGAIPISAAMLPLGVPIAVVLLGPRWVPAGHAIAGLCGFLLSTTIISIASELFKSVSRPGFLIRVHGVAFASIAVGVTVGAIVWGLIGVAVAMSVSGLITAAVALVCVCSLTDITGRQVLSWFAGPLMASAVMVGGMLAYAAIVDPLGHAPVVRLLLVIAEAIVGALIYSAALGVIDAPRRREAHRQLAGLIARRKRAPEAAGIERQP